MKHVPAKPIPRWRPEWLERVRSAEEEGRRPFALLADWRARRRKSMLRAAAGVELAAARRTA